MKTQKEILIIGAGLCGSLLALRLGQLGYNVKVMEKRPDLRESELKAGRSINLALSNRGLKALKLVGLENKVKSICIPMNGRMLHDKKGITKMSKSPSWIFTPTKRRAVLTLTPRSMNGASKCCKTGTN